MFWVFGGGGGRERRGIFWRGRRGKEGGESLLGLWGRGKGQCESERVNVGKQKAGINTKELIENQFGGRQKMSLREQEDEKKEQKVLKVLNKKVKEKAIDI